MITGLITYKEKKCVFKLKGFTLEVDELEDREKIYIDDLDYIFGESVSTKEYLPKKLLGKDFENGKDIIFNIRNLASRSPKTYIFNLYSYAVFNKNESSFDGLTLSGEEFNWFYNIRNAYEYTVVSETGELQFNIKPFEDLSKTFEFNLEDELVEGELNVTRQISNMDTSPIKVHTDLYLRFEETTDYSKIHKLINLVADFFKFVTYRRNISINHITLSKKDENKDRQITIGTFYINREKNIFTEEGRNLRERMIDLQLLEESMSNLFNRLQKKAIYLTHIPESSVDKRRITPSRFVMVTAGFEWQFRLSYEALSNKVEEASKKDEAKEELLMFLEEKISSSTGEKKKYFKDEKKKIINMNMSMSSKIEWALAEFSDILDRFIKDIYNMNQIKDVKYKDIAERIQNQRNDYAHGNIDKEINSIIGLDLNVLEWLYYTMVLSDIGMSRDNIQKTINKLFSRGYAF
ncbi:HEPN domain-containing protein [Priestia aryabhattai]